VDKALANRVDLLKLKQAAADGEPEAIKQLEDIYKKAEEKASVKTKQILIELEALRTNVQNRIAGFGKATLKSKS
jgi:predicted RecB family endonuclease